MKKLAQVLFVVLIIFSLQKVTHAESASGFVKYPLNPIFSPNTNNWDSVHVDDPNVIKINNTYNVWYTANGGLGWRIGYASSSSGLSNWSRTSQPVIPPGSNDGWEKETLDPSVIYDPQSSTYQIWFTSMNSDHWQNGDDRFRTRYATSIDGLNWTKGNWVLTGTAGLWDSGGPGRGISVVYHDGIYHLWYGGTNSNDVGTNPFWRIGYAASTDGINWVKQNTGNPVITPTTPWELNNVSFPTVLYSNGVYHMWYGASSTDMPTQIVYAYSVDGINWIKPADHNPVLQGTSGGFDQGAAFVSTVLKEDYLKMWYSGFDGAHWHIGYATASADWLPTVTPPPTPIPTPIPTLSPTPIPTPIIPTKKVILIPGMTASWNMKDILLCTTGVNDQWSLFPVFAPDVYNPILQRLQKEGWTTYTFTYDWRQRVSDNAKLLKTFIDAHVSSGEKVDIIAHSMGGLVARSYVEQEGTNNKVDKLITVGTPHQGSVDAYPLWSAAALPTSGDPVWRFGLLALDKFCWPKTHNDRITVQQFFPSIQDILPTFPYLIDNQTNQVKPVQSMVAKNTWLLNSTFNPPYYNVTVGTLSGTNQITQLAFRTVPPSLQDLNLGNWLDGKPIQIVTTMDGDNRVLLTSSTLPGADNLGPIDAEHAHLISSTDGMNKIMDFLHGAQMAQAMMLSSPQTQTMENHLKGKEPHEQPETPTSGLFLIAYPGKLWVIEPIGKFVKDTDGLVSIVNPKSGIYKVIFWPKEKESHLIVAQMLEDKNLWKDYTFKSRFPSFFAPQIHFLYFDAQHPKEDILR